MSLAGWLNTAWMLKAAPEAWAFRRATHRVAQAQERILAEVIAQNQQTSFGRRHGFSAIRGVRDYQQRVPLSRYENYVQDVASIAAGDQSVLTRERVELLEPTSGTTAGEKLIPYTAGLRRQFQRGIAAWIADLFWHRPALRRGRAYWSVSPALGTARRTAAGIPIGFDDDAAYLGTLEQFALERVLAVPSAVARLSNIDSFRYCTLLCLLRAEDLTLISIWNPTFLTSLLARLEPWADQLVFDLRHGTVHRQSSASNDVTNMLPRRRNEGRAAKLQAIFRSAMSLAEKLQLIWPRLNLISCWADAAAAHCLPGLRSFFPRVDIQPKGLLATEGFVSFPLIGQPAPVLSVRSHFFEFQEVHGLSEDGPCRLAHELEHEGVYRVVLTTAGGLSRYQLRDEVHVVGFLNQCPLLRFLGKADCVSDLVGEKLAEPHVRSVLDRLFAVHRMQPSFALLVPVTGTPPRYRLYLQRQTASDTGSALCAFTAGLESGLCENPHYAYAVRLGQLAPVEVTLLSTNSDPAWSLVERRSMSLGQRVGDIKPRALDSWTGWPDTFELAVHSGT